MDRDRIEQIKEKIAQLPCGNITYKTINGKRYPYYQWSENGKQRGRVVKAYELDELSASIEQRKALQKELLNADAASAISEDVRYHSIVKCGKELVDFVSPVKKLRKRECYVNSAV